MKTERKKEHLLIYALLFFGIFMLVPIYILFMASLRNESTIFVSSFVTANPTLDSLKTALTPQFIRSIGNSFLVASVVTVVAMILHAMCGYALARMNFFGKEAVFNIIISTLMIPVSSILVPLFMVSKILGITNSFAGLILPSIFNAYGIFLFRQYYLKFSKGAGRSGGTGRLFPLQDFFHHRFSFVQTHYRSPVHRIFPRQLEQLSVASRCK